MAPARPCSFEVSTSVAITLAPAATKASAMARPMPCPAAVTSATLPASRPVMGYGVLCGNQDAGERRCKRASSGPLGQTTHLALNKVTIQSVVPCQIIGWTILDHLPGMQHDHPIEMAHGREPMRDRNHGSSAHEPAERFADSLLRIAIKRGSGFVQQ